MVDKEPLYSPLKDCQPIFCQWSSSHTPRINNIVLNFKTKEQRKLFANMYFRSSDKTAITSTQGWTNSFGTAHSKMGSTTFVNEEVYTLRDIIIDSAKHWHNRAKETICKYVTGVHWQKRCYFHSGMDKQSWYSPLKDGRTTFVNEVVYILRDIIIDSARHWCNRAKETTYKYVTGVHWQKRCYFHSGMDKQPWYSPLKDGQHNFCQWSSLHTQWYNNWQCKTLMQ